MRAEIMTQHGTELYRNTLTARILCQPARRIETHQLNAARLTFELQRAHIAASQSQVVLHECVARKGLLTCVQSLN
jgi:hypothetical protein